ncbi:MAG: DUF1998 domain-containing protein, partial [Chlorobium sp.]|nr:DUF1998 domain-containing protein [Chlorobium sp.]
VSVMATLQAALKRGIEHAFQIEESEMMTEALPNGDTRKAILFYEAAEGGAGVLNRLAGEAGQFADVARQALRVMHFAVPDGPFDIETLHATEQRRPDGGRLCEAGCYVCLLSYFNQPDHEKINRLEPEALKLLVALANSSVQANGVASITPLATVDYENGIAEWLAMLDSFKLRRPDAFSVLLQGVAAIADAQYKETRALVFFAEPDAAVREYVENKGQRVLVFPASPDKWPDIFAQYPEIFGRSGA